MKQWGKHFQWYLICYFGVQMIAKNIKQTNKKIDRGVLVFYKMGFKTRLWPQMEGNVTIIGTIV